MNRELMCDYATGMFACEGRLETGDMFVHLREMQLLSFHEAGHAVVAYALGLGCTRISLMATLGESDGVKSVAYHGVANWARAATRQVNRRLKAGIYCKELLANAVAAAAGPAAERKHVLAVGGTLRTLMGSGGDHQEVDEIAKRLGDAGRDRYAFQRLVWRRAQRLLQIDTIWRAVESLAEELYRILEDVDLAMDEDGTPGTGTGTMPGATARAIMRRAGVFPGMLCENGGGPGVLLRKAHPGWSAASEG